ncbi:MAG: hypothetical protein WD772_09750 [Pseudohongiellaceae bacterium]
MKAALKAAIKAVLTDGMSKALITILLLVGGSLQSALAQDFIWAPDFPVGTSIIEISAPDQNGTDRTFEDLKGEQGLLFMLSRSFDW